MQNLTFQNAESLNTECYRKQTQKLALKDLESLCTMEDNLSWIGSKLLDRSDVHTLNEISPHLGMYRFIICALFYDLLCIFIAPYEQISTLFPKILSKNAENKKICRRDIKLIEK